MQTAPTLQDSKARMQSAVLGWIEGAHARVDGADLLDRRADSVEQQLQTLSAYASDRCGLPSHLVGLTAFDLSAALADLRCAATALRLRVAA